MYVNTFQTPAMSPAIDVPGVDYELIRRDTSASHGEKMRGLHEEHEIALENMNLREGYPESAIPQTAEEIKAQINDLTGTLKMAMFGTFGFMATLLVAFLTGVATI